MAEVVVCQRGRLVGLVNPDDLLTAPAQALLSILIYFAIGVNLVR